MSELGTPTVDVPVLVIGGSLVGLATSMFLAQHGVDVLSVEKHHGTAIHPRAGYFQLRTIELMRVAGIEDRVRAARSSCTTPTAVSTPSRRWQDGRSPTTSPTSTVVSKTSARRAACSCPSKCSSRSCCSAPRVRGPLPVLDRARPLRAGRLGRDCDGAQRYRRHRGSDPGWLHGRLRREPKPDSREPRHRDDRPRAAVAQCDDLLPSRLFGGAARQEPRRDLRQQSASARLLPAREDRPRRVPGGVHRRRHQRTGSQVRSRQGHRRPGCSIGPRGGRRPRSRG